VVRGLEINGVRDGVLRAVARLEVEGIRRDFDLRPVDAAGLAVALELPLCAAGRVLSATGIPAGRLYRSREEVGAGLRTLTRSLQRSAGPKSAWTRIGSLLRGS
jgi:hypothetical protein